VEAGSSVSIGNTLEEVSISSGSGRFLPRHERVRPGFHFLLRYSIKGGVAMREGGKETKMRRDK
jgi:hypothetical protein